MVPAHHPTAGKACNRENGNDEFIGTACFLDKVKYQTYGKKRKHEPDGARPDRGFASDENFGEVPANVFLEIVDDRVRRENEHLRGAGEQVEIPDDGIQKQEQQ